MNRYNFPYAAWLAINLTWLSGFFWMYYHGVIEEIFSVDSHYLVTFTFSVFLVGCAFTGWSAVKFSSSSTQLLRRRTSVSWFLSQQLLNLGLIGTTLGFIGMLTAAFGKTGSVDSSVFQSVMPLIGKNWAAALYATVTALSTSVILMLQTFAVDYFIEVRDDDASV